MQMQQLPLMASASRSLAFLDSSLISCATTSESDVEVSVEEVSMSSVTWVSHIGSFSETYKFFALLEEKDPRVSAIAYDISKSDGMATYFQQHPAFEVFRTR